MDHEKDLKDNFIRVVMNEDVWNIYLVDDDDNVVTEEDHGAATDFSAKEIFIRKGELSLEVIQHELWHVYVGYCYLSDTNDITTDDMEEITAALFSDKGSRIITKSEQILKQLLDLREQL